MSKDDAIHELAGKSEGYKICDDLDVKKVDIFFEVEVSQPLPRESDGPRGIHQ